MFRSGKEPLHVWSLPAAATLSGGIILLILVFLGAESLPALRQVGGTRFFTDASWYPAEYASGGTFNLFPMVVGTLAATAGAVGIAVPLGILSAVFCHYYASAPLARTYRRVVELLAGIPSVVYGFWGLVVLVPLLRQWQPPGQSLLAGICILALMILPTIALLTDAALAQVPRTYLQAAAALGLARATVLWRVALPTARSGIVSGILLATGRALGETMAILMVCGNIVQVPGSLFDPIRTLTSNIALELGYALGVHRSALFVSGLLLTVLVIVLVAAAEVVNREKRYG